METLPVSVFIVTLNEEKNLPVLLKSTCFADEIIVVDSGSTDNTIEIAKSFGATVVSNPWPGYAKQKQFAMELCRNDWVLNLDADEEMTPALTLRFKEIIEEDKYSSVRCLRDNMFMGRPLSPWSKKPDNNRLFKKSLAKFDDSVLVHESATVEGREIFIHEILNHYGYGDIKVLTHKNNLYSSLKAQEKFNKGKKHSLIKLFLIFPLVFIKEYILQRKVFSGVRGFTLSMITAYYAFTKEAKLYEHYAVHKKDTTEKSH